MPKTYNLQLFKTFAKQVREVEKNFNPIEQDIENARKLLESLNLNDSTLRSIHNFVSTIIIDTEKLLEIQEIISSPALSLLENNISIFNYFELSQDFLYHPQNDLKFIEGKLLDIPLMDVCKQLDEIQTFNFIIDEYKQIHNEERSYYFRTNISDTKNFGQIQLRTTQKIELKVNNIDEELNEIKHFVLEDSKNKDEQIQELLQYIKDDKKDIVRVNSIKFYKKLSELIIDGKSIKIKPDTNQYYLCDIIFKNKQTVKKRWDNYELLEELGEDPFDSLSSKKIYNTIRHLNSKIQKETGIKQLIIYSNKTIVVNPNYT